MRTADMIYNPGAGRFPSGILAERAANVLRSNNWSIRLIRTLDSEHGTALTRRVAGATIRDVDIGLCGDTPFLMWAGVGLDAFAIHHIEPRPRGEKFFANMTYVASTVWHASYWRGNNLKVTADHLHISGHYLLAAMSNIYLCAGGIVNIFPPDLM